MSQFFIVTLATATYFLKDSDIDSPITQSLSQGYFLILINSVKIRLLEHCQNQFSILSGFSTVLPLHSLLWLHFILQV